jgi:hypothetical protein
LLGLRLLRLCGLEAGLEVGLDGDGGRTDGIGRPVFEEMRDAAL